MASTQRDGLVSSAATYNETSSNAKIQLEAWYQENLSGKLFEDKIRKFKEELKQDNVQALAIH